VLPTRRLIFIGVHSVISQEIKLFITTVLRTSEPTDLSLQCNCMLGLIKPLSLSLHVAEDVTRVSTATAYGTLTITVARERTVMIIVHTRS
jgi:hypothetical protein